MKSQSTNIFYLLAVVVVCINTIIQYGYTYNVGISSSTDISKRYNVYV